MFEDKFVLSNFEIQKNSNSVLTDFSINLKQVLMDICNPNYIFINKNNVIISIIICFSKKHLFTFLKRHAFIHKV